MDADWPYPILDYQPEGGVPVGSVSNPPVYSQADITQLIEGQAYVDVVFGSVQTTEDWVLVTCEVENTTDFEPLNIWPGIITNRTQAGFRVQLNGLPDSDSYFLHWAVSGVNILPVPATLYLFTGPTSGIFGLNNTFTVRLPPSTTLVTPITITPDDGGAGGTFSPPTVTLSGGSASATFTYNAVAYGAVTINVTNSGTLIDPASIVYTSIAPVYTFSGPTGGTSGVASTNFSVQVAGEAVLAVPTTVTPHDGGAGGTFTPTTVLLVPGVPQHFTYTPASAGTITISVTNNGGLVDPVALTYTATAAPLHDGDAVSAWPDSSVNGHDATQSGSVRPIFKTGIIGGKPVVRYTSAASQSMNIASISSVSPWTAIVVMKPTSLAVTMESIAYGGGGGVLGPFANNDGTIYVIARARLNSVVNPSLAFHVFSGVVVGTSDPGIFIDGSSVSGGAAPVTIALNFDTLGKGDGDLAEVIFYNTNLGTTDRANVEKYLGTKYGITVAGGTAVQPDTVTGLVGWWKADSLG